MDFKIADKVVSVKTGEESSEKIKLFTIENKNGTRMIVSNIGAAVVSLFVKNKNGQFVDVVLGYPAPADYLADEFYIGTVVGRYANRIATGNVTIDNKHYQLSVKKEGYHQHGGEIGFNKKIFDATPFKTNNENGIVFNYTSPHLEEGFPGELSLEVVYTLTEDDAWKIEYKATCSETTLVNITQHSYFNLSGNPVQTIDAHELKINGDYYLPVNALQLPTGILETVTNSPFDFTKFKSIAKDINCINEQLKVANGYDHTYVLDKENNNILKHAAVVKEENSGIKMEVYTTEPSVHFYSGNFLSGIAGKNGITYNQRSGFCLETEHFPDSPNHPGFPSTLLKPGEEFYSQTIFKFSVE